MFSEKTTPVSELIAGNPDRPLREPALVVLACLFNGFQIYQLLQILPQLSAPGTPGDPFDPFSFLNLIMSPLITGLIGWYIAYCIILLVGAAIVYFVNQRIGSALILVISIIGLLVGFVGVGFTFIYSFSVLSLITGLMAPLLGLIAGIYGIRSKDSGAPTESREVI